MRFKIPTQILLSTVTRAKPGAKGVDPKFVCAWNLFTSLYFKCGGVPWAPTGLPAGTCFVGVSFFRPLGADATSMRSSVAQAFDEHGDGLVLRGQDFTWNERESGPSPHLTRENARDLIALVLRRYESEMKQRPSRVVVHKSSRFWAEERSGFLDGLAGIHQTDLLAVEPVSDVRLLRAGKYPPLRGTRFSLGDCSYLYSTGYISALNAYPHGHVPSPLQISEHVGDAGKDDLLREILMLTKMNWNSAGFAGSLPITLRFSRLVGDILRELPAGREPEPQYRYYI
jgi:hypothetical protein